LFLSFSLPLITRIPCRHTHKYHKFSSNTSLTHTHTHPVTYTHISTHRQIHLHTPSHTSQTHTHRDTHTHLRRHTQGLACWGEGRTETSAETGHEIDFGSVSIETVVF